MAEKSAENLINGIEASKKVPFERVLFGLGIRYVGETVAKKLAKHYKKINALAEASFDDLIQVDEIGDRIAESVVAFFEDEKNRTIIQRLQDDGLQLQIYEEELAGQTNVLEGKTFVISGVFEKVSRSELKRLIEKNGGKNTSSISKKTNYLVAGENMGTAKLKKAEDLGVNLLTEDEFLQMLNFKTE